MPPKKGKMRPEPDVNIPEGDAGAGRGIFDSQCGACHALEGGNICSDTGLQWRLVFGIVDSYF